jgi:hypothetical protein
MYVVTTLVFLRRMSSFIVLLMNYRLLAAVKIGRYVASGCFGRMAVKFSMSLSKQPRQR